MTLLSETQGKYAKLPSEELILLYREQNEQNQEMLEEIVLRYTYIIKSIAVQMRGVYASFAQVDDIISEGVIALMSAVERFDPEKNAKFETYASLRIRGRIIDLARKQDWIPRSVRKAGRDIDRAVTELYTELGRHPTDLEIAQKMGLTLEKYLKVLGDSSMHNVLSLDMLVEEQELAKRVALEDKSVEASPESTLQRSELSSIIKETITHLRDKEQLVISLYYEKELSMKEIAVVLNVSEPRVSQIHSSAIRKLRTSLEKYNRGE